MCGLTPGPVVLEGEWPEFDGVDVLCSPRRRVLDRVTSQFLGVLGGIISPADYFTPRNLLRLIGARGLLQAMRSRRRMRA